MNRPEQGITTIRNVIMRMIKINRKNNNIELVSKLMNSVAVKYDCRVKYHPETGTVSFHGNDAYKPFIAEETMNLFNTI
jgi:hypothetical protein